MNRDDGLTEVLHEEAYVKEALMWVDSALPSDISTVVIAFFVFVGAALICGLRGDPALLFESSHRNFTGNGPQSFHFDAAPVSAFNRFLTIKLSFSGSSVAPAQPVTFSYAVQTNSGRVIGQKIGGQVKDMFLAVGSSGTTRTLSLFTDRQIDYTAVQLVVSVPGVTPSLSGVSAHFSLGQHDHTTFQIYFRFVFGILDAAILYYVVPHLGWLSYWRWALSQRLTLPLLVLALFSNNPAYLFQAYFPKTMFFYVDLLFTPLFHGFFYFSALVVLDSIIRKSDNLALSRAGPKATIALAKWICEFLQAWRGLSFSFSGRPPIGYDGVGWLLGVSELAADGLFFAAGFYCLLETAMYSNSAGAAKVNAYLQSFSLVILNVGLISVLGKIFGIFNATAVEWTFQFVIYNLVVLLMGWLHWPVEAPLQPEYGEGEEPEVLNPEQVLEPQDVDQEPEESSTEEETDEEEKK
jgi:hypothetical protein